MTRLEHGTPHRHMRQFLYSGLRVDGRLVGPEIVNIGPGSLLRLTHTYRLTGNDFCDLSGGILHIARDNGAFRTDHHAGWLQAKFGAMRAIVALGGGMAVWVNIERIIGAGLHTRFAANTAIGVKINDAILPLIQSAGRADLDAGSVITMIAAVDQEIAARVGEFSALDILHPGAIDTDRYIVFGFTGNCTGVTANALALVNHKSILRHVRFPPLSNAHPLQ